MVWPETDAAKVPGIRHHGVGPFPASRECYWDPVMSNVDMDREGVWPNIFSLGEA